MARNAGRAVLDPVARSLGKLPELSGKRILLALSGGADSVALLHALVALRRKFHFELAAAHLNHALRGAESDRDEAFVRELCGGLGVPLTVERARGLKRAKGNLEARARSARQRFLARAAEAMEAHYIALAHQADDQAETVLMRLLRGAGVTGLGAMDELSGKVIRPLLEVRRAALLAYLAEIGAQFVEDSTNASLAHDRNRVRHRLMPLLEGEFAPGLSARLVELATEMRQVDDLLRGLADHALKDCLDSDDALNLDHLKRLHPAVAAATLRRFVATRMGDLFGLERAHIEALQRLCIKGPPNGRITLPNSWLAWRRYGKLLLGKHELRDRPVCFAVPLAVEGVTVVAPARARFESAVLPRAQALMPRDACEALFDARGVSASARLIVRNFNPGDRIAPLGVPGSRKVKDVFIDHKIPPPQRSRFPVVWLGGCVVWLPGLARSKVALVTESTAEVVRLTVRSERCVGFKPRASVY